MKQEKEHGAIVVEAIISLSTFIFVFFTIYSIINICYIQAKMNTALNTAAKEVSQYSYLYFKLGAGKAEQELHGKAEGFGETVDGITDGVGTFLGALQTGSDSVGNGDLSGLFDAIETGKTSAESLYDQFGDIMDDPKTFIFGMASMGAEQGLTEIKGVLAGLMAKSFMKKNLVAFDGDTPDAFLKRYDVVGGMDGLSFDGSELMTAGGAKIRLVLSYEVRMIRLLDIDVTFNLRQFAITDAWGCEAQKITD